MPNYLIDLSEAIPLSQGAEHLVFQHPDRPDQLIKVMKPSSKTHRIRRPAVRRFGALRIWHREMSEYLAAMAHGGHCDRLARQFGLCETTRGLGIISERIEAPDGSLAPTLHKYVASIDKDPTILQALHADADALFDDLRRYRVDWEDVTGDNVVVTGGSTPRMVIIDGLGSPTLIPLTHLSDWLFLRSSRTRQALLHKFIPGTAAA